MRLLHHVKEQGKTITLHLKRHHKKYIFGVLSVSLLVKGISLIIAHSLVHNLSFANTNTVTKQNDDSNINTEISDNELEGNAHIENTNENNEYSEDNINNDNENKETDETNLNENEFNTEINNNKDTQNYNYDINNENGNNTHIQEEGTGGEYWMGNNEGTQIENENNGEIHNHEENNNENTNTGETADEEDLGNYGESEIKKGNGKCDEGDLEIISPIAGDTVGKSFDITREFTNDDCENDRYTIRLRNANEQYLDIFTGNYGTTGFTFNSTQLETDYFTGHKIAIVSDKSEILYWNSEGGEFTIDNKAPTLSNIKTKISAKNNKLNIGDTITISFESDEELTGINVSILGQSALLQQKRWKKYTYTLDFSNKNTEGKIVYGIDYSDTIGNTGYYEGYENIELDYTNPTIDKFEMINNGRYGIKLTYTTNEETNSHLVYIQSGADKTNSLDSTGKDYAFTINNIRNNNIYNYSISIEDEAKNTLNIGGTFKLSGNDIIFTKQEIEKGNLITEIGFKTGDEKELIEDLKQQFNNFDTCSKNINTIKLDLPIKGKTANVKMPSFSDQNVNKLTNAFTVVLVQRLEKKDLSQKALNEITEDLNNFLLVVKIVKDDNNECKQNMTQYYINRFKKTLIKYGIINQN